MYALAADDQSDTNESDGVEKGPRFGRQVAPEAGLAVAGAGGGEVGLGVEIDSGVESGVGGGWK